ncbi:hypothetical protein QWZ04_08755 [Vibrio tapetis subsp. quintayensis]|uniref:tetratricopeptide repeat protein n=1 Tax=Vibrio tapetis TaxID=52443 RepID=UPI0025B57F18|nr:hypothetical protein [Vibrio tapetis]MDN3680416.1 hypothetical protein [Vibrio tapetis subsp. quintayensis]
MSVINKALSDMTEKKGSTAQPLEKVNVAPIKSSNKAVSLLAAGGLVVGVSAGLFFWLNSAESEVPSSSQVVEPAVMAKQSPQPSSQPVTTTVSLTTPQDSPPESEPVLVKPAPRKVEQVNIESSIADGTELSDEDFAQVTPAVSVESSPKAKPAAPKVETPKPKSTPAKTTKVESPAPIVKNEPAQTAKQNVLETGVMEVVQVELTPQQLADKASSRARKALDANDYGSAIKAYESALRYTPRDENIRKRVAALYYGRSDTRRAVRVLQQGIELDNDSQNLRLALVNILIKQELPQAALGVIEHLPENPDVDYLAARAGLAQQIKRQELALESYQLLTEKDGNNAKWWLGLAISQERSDQLDSAKVSYNKALNRVGLSNKTHDFIRSRLVVIQETKKVQNAD